MIDANKVTEVLKELEVQAYDLKTDFNSLKYKLEIAYKYEEELLVRLESARKKTKEIQINLFDTSNKISDVFQKMKNQLDIFTGNFYNNIK